MSQDETRSPSPNNWKPRRGRPKSSPKNAPKDDAPSPKMDVFPASRVWESVPNANATGSEFDNSATDGAFFEHHLEGAEIIRKKRESLGELPEGDRKSTRLNSSHSQIS